MTQKTVMSKSTELTEHKTDLELVLMREKKDPKRLAIRVLLHG